MKKNIFGMIVMITLASKIYAQDSIRYSTLSVGVGAQQIFNKDKFQSPFTYKGVNAVFSAEFSRVSSVAKQTFHVDYSFGQIQSAVSPSANNKMLFLKYDYLFNLTRNESSKFKFSVGPGMQAFMSRTNYLPGIELSNGYYSAGVYLGISSEASLRLGKKSALQLKTYLPVAGLIYRPDFDINGKSSAHMKMAGTNLLFSSELRYVYKVNHRVSVFASFNFNYISVEQPRPMNLLTTAGLLGMSRTF